MRSLILASTLCFVATFVSANSVNIIPITGTASDGYAETLGDFSIQGVGLSLSQGLPDGSNQIGTCTVGTICHLSFTPANSDAFCSYCTSYSGGSLGSKVAEYLESSLTFTGSAFYSGGTNLLMPFAVAGTITGYELVDCVNGTSGCKLGPAEFTVHIFAQGTEDLTLYSNSGPGVPIYGANAQFSGVAAVVDTVPEPTSMLLMGTGVVCVWLKLRWGIQRHN